MFEWERQLIRASGLKSALGGGGGASETLSRSAGVYSIQFNVAVDVGVACARRHSLRVGGANEWPSVRLSLVSATPPPPTTPRQAQIEPKEIVPSEARKLATSSAGACRSAAEGKIEFETCPDGGTCSIDRFSLPAARLCSVKSDAGGASGRPGGLQAASGLVQFTRCATRGGGAHRVAPAAYILCGAVAAAAEVIRMRVSRPRRRTIRAPSVLQPSRAT